MNLKKTLRALGAVVLDESERNPDFAQRLIVALGEAESSVRDGHRTRQSMGKTKSRPAAVIDPVATLADQGETALRSALLSLALDQLRDIVAEFAMDPSKLVMKWKKSDRVIEHIVENSKRRSVKGDAFRS